MCVYMYMYVYLYVHILYICVSVYVCVYFATKQMSCVHFKSFLLSNYSLHATSCYSYWGVQNTLFPSASGSHRLSNSLPFLSFPTTKGWRKFYSLWSTASSPMCSFLQISGHRNKICILPFQSLKLLSRGWEISGSAPMLACSLVHHF